MNDTQAKEGKVQGQGVVLPAKKEEEKK